jgi:glutamate N-acetyltransferase/amino-acid N-acetyltransferase
VRDRVAVAGPARVKIDPGPAPGPVAGFRFAGVHGGLKTGGRRDTALVVADSPVPTAAVFTRNTAAAAPVVVARKHVADGLAQAVLINSGNANAATGSSGLKLAEWSCRELATRLGIKPGLVLPCSTGVIGVQLDRRRMARAISLATDALGPSRASACGRAMMTSDAFPKWASRSVRLPGGETATVAGLAKGAGMIHPGMATLLCVLVTDAPLSSGAARAVLAEAVASSFNSITVDGDTSTNDTVVLMASGLAGGEAIRSKKSAGYELLATAVGELTDELSRMVVRDGEGATRVVNVLVEGAPGDADAERAARAVATSTLVKAAFAGGDPNWGRIVCALGNSGVDVDFKRVAISVDDVALVKAGELLSEEARRRAARVMKNDTFTLAIRLGRGPGRARIVTSDLTEAYVRFNTAYS